MTFSLETISTLLDRHHRRHSDRMEKKKHEGKTRAAVAMILRQGERGLELLFIQRALFPNDPWSGNIAFPGGKAKPGEALKQAAEREAAEEVGLDLAETVYLGRLPEVTGSTLPVSVSCFVYWLPGSSVLLTPNQEVYDTYWADLEELTDPNRRVVTTVNFGGEAMEMPAIMLAWPGAPVLWGLTYRLATQFVNICLKRGLVE